VLTSLHHVIDLDWMRKAYELTRKDGATGIDGVTADEYGMNLEANLTDLLDRIKSGRYRAPPVRRSHIPKADGSQRPLGIPTFEDKVAQRAIVMVLEVIYEQDFRACSHGFRPRRSAHGALRELYSAITRQGQYWVLDVDIRKYFDSIPHHHLRAFLDQRVTDGVIRRMIDKWLKAGVLEDGLLHRETEGTPQGGVVSPMLSNIYLHHVLDEWFEDEVRPRLTGSCTLVRYADDFVMTFKNHHDAKRVLEVLGKRLGRYGLMLHPDKTRFIDFRPERQGGTHPDCRGPTAVRLSRLHPYLGEVAERQERGAANDGEEPACPRAGHRQRLVSDQPPLAGVVATPAPVCEADRSLCLLWHHGEHSAARAVRHPSRAAVAEMAGTSNTLQAAHVGTLRQVPRPSSASSTMDCPSLRQRQRRSPVKNRMREICTSGSVGGEGGNILTYPAVPGGVCYRAEGGPRDPLLRVTMTRAANKVAARSRRESRTTGSTGPGRKSPRWSAARRASRSWEREAPQLRRLRAGHGTRTRVPRRHPMRLWRSPPPRPGWKTKPSGAPRRGKGEEREGNEVAEKR